jgi:hypothetical protein
MEELYETILQALALLRGARNLNDDEGLDYSVWAYDNRISTLEAVMFFIESRK